MGSLKVWALAGAAAVVTLTSANAADMPPVIHHPAPAPVADFAGGWYLRGDIGVSNQRVKSLFNVLYDTADSVETVSKGFDAAPFFGVGLGYQFNSWLRFDVTGEYRAKANFRALDVVTFTDGLGGTANLADDYHASKSELVFLANAYFDLGTWYGITPFVGAGVGAAYNRISNFRDIGIGFLSDGTPIQSVAYGGSASKWNLAWAVHAGLAYRVTPAFTVELAYRYLNLGNALSGDLIAFDGTNTVNNPMHFRDIDSHDLKLGVRWMFDAPVPAYAPALMTRG